MDHALVYAGQMQAILADLPMEPLRRAQEILRDARLRGAQVFTLGNGGSAANASHLACDLGKSCIRADLPRFRVISLVDNVPLATAWANDTDYVNIFAEQLDSLLDSGDVVLAISASGNSPNVIKAVEKAKEMGAVTIGWSGYDGGKLGRAVDIPIVIKSDNMQRIEDVQLILGHVVFHCLMKECSA